MRFLLHVMTAVALASCGPGTETDPRDADSSNKASAGAFAGEVATVTETTADTGFRPRPDLPGDCPLVIEFASYGAGISGITLQAVKDLLAQDPAVTAVKGYPWGREGEVSLCVRVEANDDAERLFHAIGNILPADPHGPVSVGTSSGLSFSVPQRAQ